MNLTAIRPHEKVQLRVKNSLRRSDWNDQVPTIQESRRDILAKKVKPLARIHENKNATSFDQCGTPKQSSLEEIGVELKGGQCGEIGRFCVEEAREVKKLHV